MAILLPKDFKEFLKLLNENQVEYLLVGGYAVSFHGYPRATADMDIWIAINPDNAGKIVTVLRDFGFNPPDLSPQLFLKKWQIIRLGLPPVRIEITTSISGVDFNDCFTKRIVAEVDGVKTNLINLSDLKTNKKASARHQDIADIEHLP
jgi:hypothetical protein